VTALLIRRPLAEEARPLDFGYCCSTGALAAKRPRSRRETQVCCSAKSSAGLSVTVPGGQIGVTRQTAPAAAAAATAAAAAAALVTGATRGCGGRAGDAETRSDPRAAMASGTVWAASSAHAHHHVCRARARRHR